MDRFCRSGRRMQDIPLYKLKLMRSSSSFPPIPYPSPSNSRHRWGAETSDKDPKHFAFLWANFEKKTRTYFCKIWFRFPLYSFRSTTDSEADVPEMVRRSRMTPAPPSNSYHFSTVLSLEKFFRSIIHLKKNLWFKNNSKRNTFLKTFTFQSQR